MMTHRRTPQSNTSSLTKTVERMYKTVVHVSTGVAESASIVSETCWGSRYRAGRVNRYEK